MVGTTHHIDQIQKMRNGNRKPVETYCGGWNCLHDWGPDPFADEADPGSFQTRQDQGEEIRLRANEAGRAQFRRGQNYRHFRRLDDPEAYHDRARSASVSDDRLQNKVERHPELGSVENARKLTQYVREDPDQTYYQFQDGRSTIAFERDRYFLAATEDEVKTYSSPEVAKTATGSTRSAEPPSGSNFKLMSISEANKEDAIEGYRHYSKTLDNSALREFHTDLDSTDLCNVRSLLEDASLSESEAASIEKADTRLVRAFDAEILGKYAEAFPELPIRDWWG